MKPPKKVIVLGATGMLGSMIIDVLSRDPTIKVTATVRNNARLDSLVNRITDIQWQSFDADAGINQDYLSIINNHEWVINAIGITKPHINDDNAFEVERAIRINSSLPYEISQCAKKNGALVIQIATDCVFSGNRGNYLENDFHDALDVYGKTKSLGEVRSDHVHHLRCSIIGPEPREHKFLLDWFLGQPKKACVSGYSNHLWNGVTTLHFAKLCHGIISKSISLPNQQHVLPNGCLDKYSLLRCFAKEYHREDVTIKSIDAAVAVNRTLITSNMTLNMELWSAAGYSQPPTIPEMIAELAVFNYRHLDTEFMGGNV